jgi:hypothetical protein
MLGLARVPLSCLTFPDEIAEGRRDESEENIQRLLRIYRLEGCDRAEERHFIKGYTTEAVAEELAKEKPKDFTNENDAPIPLITVPVSCAEGLHRIKAAELFLEGGDKWWVVKLHNEQGKALSLSREERKAHNT